MEAPAASHRRDTQLQLRGLVKRFGDLVAVNQVDIDFTPGEVHALLGENGAGKSTLMNLAAGFLTPDAGSILINGEPARFASPKDALSAGVGMVHQHFRLVERFTVAENLAIGSRDVPVRTSARILNRRAEEIAERYGMPIQSARPVGTLSVGEKQRVEILRTLSRGARILILDEPTAVLTPDESDQLCRNLREMAADGAAIVFISHKLNEVLSVADRISVMRKGKLFATKERAECDLATLAKMMFEDARDDTSGVVVPPYDGPRKDVLTVTGVSARDDRGVRALRDVDLVVGEHEIVGIVGVAGNGQQELEEVVAGLRRAEAGSVSVDGNKIERVRGAMRAGLAHIPEDRLGSGLAAGQPIWRNAILRTYRKPPISSGVLVRSKQAKEFAQRVVADVDLSTSDVSTLVQHLSGGNAQKLLVGRELDGERRAVVAVNPTQGLDVKAATAVRTRLVEARERDLAVLLISADLDEVLQLADRVLVLYEGRIVGEFPRAKVDRDAIGRLMGGERVEDSSHEAAS